MGYRHYFYAIPKTEIAEIRNCVTNEDFCSWAKNHGYEVDRYEGEKPYCGIYNIGKKIYEFGKYVDWAFDMESKNEKVFLSDELKERYEDFGFVLCTQDDFLTAINEYKRKVVSFLESLIENGEVVSDRCKEDIKSRLYEWKNPFGTKAINTDLSTSCISQSWLYEYAVFELVRLYKTFDWDNDALVLVGW